MSRLRAIVGLCLSTAIGMAAGCFRDGTPPPGFRYYCDTDADCQPLFDDMGEPVLDDDGEPFVEQCIDGLCQYACSGSVLGFIDPMAKSGCPPDREGYTCFNGTCNHLCDAAAEPSECSTPQTCVAFAEIVGDVPDLEDLLAMLPQERPGLCGVLCDPEDATTCPDGQLCFDGVCVDLSGGASDSGTTSGGDTSGATSDDMTGSTGL